MCKFKSYMRGGVEDKQCSMFMRERGGAVCCLVHPIKQHKIMYGVVKGVNILCKKEGGGQIPFIKKEIDACFIGNFHNTIGSLIMNKCFFVIYTKSVALYFLLLLHLEC